MFNVNIFMSFTAVSDQFQPQRPTTNSTAENGGMIGFYILMGVSAALLAVFVILLFYFRNKARTQNPVAEVQMLSFL